MGKKVIICFNREEENEVKALVRRFRTVHEDMGYDADDLEVEIIYPCDIAAGKYMTWEGTEPSKEDKEILNSLTPEDTVYVWGHGAPNYAYIPGASYVELADYLEKGLNKDNFGPGKGPLNINVETCNGGRGGEQGKSSFSARLHSLLGKKGIHATVTGRLKNVVVDTSLLPIEGIKTIDRAYDGLLHAGFTIADKRYKRMAPRSKVTYRWDPSNPDIQIRVDSYRRSTLRGFIKLKESILEKLNSSDVRPLNPGQLHRIMLTIELNLAQFDKPLDTNLVKEQVLQLQQYCLTSGITSKELQEFGLDYFLGSLGKKATKDGLLVEKTGVQRNDPLLEIEKQSFYEFINDHPAFKELDRLSHLLQEKNLPKTTKLAEIIGSKETCDGDDLYATFFIIARSHNLIKNDGNLVVPDYVEKSMGILNKMISLAYESDLDYSQKIKEIDALKKQMVFYKNADYQFEKMADLQNQEPKEGAIYFEVSSPGILKYRLKSNEEEHVDEINIASLTGITQTQREQLMGGELSVLNSIQQQILDITSQRGHTKKELTFWGKIQAIFNGLSRGFSDFLSERHEASKLELIGNIFYQPYQSVKSTLESKAEEANTLHKVIYACEHHVKTSNVLNRQSLFDALHREQEPAPELPQPASNLNKSS
jgi:hypothetical protein